MPRTIGADDKDWLFLDDQISLSLKIQDQVEKVKELTDDVELIMTVLDIRRMAITIERRLVEYRPRLRELKKQKRSRK